MPVVCSGSVVYPGPLVLSGLFVYSGGFNDTSHFGYAKVWWDRVIIFYSDTCCVLCDDCVLCDGCVLWVVSVIWPVCLIWWFQGHTPIWFCLQLMLNV